MYAELPWTGAKIIKSATMAYNRRNILTRIAKVQEITLEHTNRGVCQEWIYSHLVYPNYTISRRTYYYWLGINARQELRKLEAQPKQMQLF